MSPPRVLVIRMLVYNTSNLQAEAFVIARRARCGEARRGLGLLRSRRLESGRGPCAGRRRDASAAAGGTPRSRGRRPRADPLAAAQSNLVGL